MIGWYQTDFQRAALTRAGCASVTTAGSFKSRACRDVLIRTSMGRTVMIPGYTTVFKSDQNLFRSWKHFSEAGVKIIDPYRTELNPETIFHISDLIHEARAKSSPRPGGRPRKSLWDRAEEVRSVVDDHGNRMKLAIALLSKDEKISDRTFERILHYARKRHEEKKISDQHRQNGRKKRIGRTAKTGNGDVLPAQGRVFLW